MSAASKGKRACRTAAELPRRFFSWAWSRSCHSQAMPRPKVVRFGKPVAGAFTFALLDVGVRAGIFKRHGLDIEISAFTGGTRLVQAETAGSIDIAFNTGPDMAHDLQGRARARRGPGVRLPA